MALEIAGGGTGRRDLRRRETLDEVVAHAVAIMVEHGVAGLSLGEVARRMGMRTPSLYTYVASKNALYDELFRRGWQACLDELGRQRDVRGPVAGNPDVGGRIVELTTAFARWCVEHPELGQLMLTRPVPAWEPSPDAFRPSADVMDLLAEELAALRERGLLAEQADVEALQQNLASAVTGVVVRQIANQPGVPFDEGVASRHLSSLLESLTSAYLPERN